MTAHATPKLWTRAAYEKVADSGALAPDERVELIEGMIVAVSPQGFAHLKMVARLTRILSQLVGTSHYVLVQCPLSLGEASLPEPDLAIVRAEFLDSGSKTPESADLAIEVCQTSLAYDRLDKASLYAKYGIPEMWIINLVDAQVEVYRRPGSMPEAPYGHGYLERAVFTQGPVTALMGEHVRVVVEELFA